MVFMAGAVLGLVGLAAASRAQQPEFRAYEIATPGGKRIGVVDMTVSGRRSRIVEVVSAMPGWPVGKRAEAVADRLRKVQQADPGWWKRLGVGKSNKAVVVTVSGLKAGDIPKASDGSPYVITADAKFAREWGLSPAGLAKQLVSGIKQTFQPARVSWGTRSSDGGSGTPMTAEDKRATAIKMKQEGDDAFSQQDFESAEANYRDAIKMSPEYAVPYLRLAELYCSQGKNDEAREVLQSAKGLKTLTSEDKAEVARLMSKVN
jgi:tetratricopeptide (TPR) repeat protein